MAKTQDEYELVFSGDEKGLVGATEKVRKGLDRITENDNKVKKSLLGFAADAATATSAAGVLTAGIVQLGNAFKVGLAASVGIGIGMQIKGAFDEITKRMEALGEARMDMEKGAGQSDVAKPMEKLRAEAAAAAEGVKKAKAELAGITGEDGMTAHSFAKGVQGIANVVTLGRFKDAYEGVEDQLRANINAANDRESEVTKEVVRKEKVEGRLTDISITEAEGPATAQKKEDAAYARFKIAREELKIAKENKVIDDNDIKNKQLAVNLQQQRAREAGAENALNHERLEVETKALKIKLDATSPLEKQYELSKLTAQLAEREAKAMESKNSDQAEFLKMKATEAAAVSKNLDEATNKGKSGKEVRQRLRDQDKAEEESKKFREKRAKDEGLIPTKRGLGGEVLEGVDPITGEKITKQAKPFGPDRKWDKIFDKPQKDAKEDAAALAAEAEKKKQAGEAAKVAEKEKLDKNSEKMKGELEKVNKHLELLRKELSSLVSKKA